MKIRMNHGYWVLHIFKLFHLSLIIRVLKSLIISSGDNVIHNSVKFEEEKFSPSITLDLTENGVS